LKIYFTQTRTEQLSAASLCFFGCVLVIELAVFILFYICTLPTDSKLATQASTDDDDEKNDEYRGNRRE
jgi:hypothetical protein